MLKEIALGTQVYPVTGYSDLRKGIDGLAGAVQEALSADPYSKSLFLFCGRRRDRIKGLLWETDGFLLLYMRLASGAFRWPRNASETRLLTEQEIRWLPEGLELDQPKAIKSAKPGALYWFTDSFHFIYRQFLDFSDRLCYTVRIMNQAGARTWKVTNSY